MNKKHLLLVTALFISAVSFSQNKTQKNYQLLFRNGKFTPAENVSAANMKAAASEVFDGKVYRIIQFNEIPKDDAKKQMQSAGINFLQYFPNYAYFVSAPASFDFSSLKANNIRSVISFENYFKLDSRLFTGDYPSWALKGDEHIDLNVLCFSDVDLAKALAVLEAKEIKVNYKNAYQKLFTVTLPVSKINELAALPFVSNVEPIDEPGTPENTEGKTDHRSNVMAGIPGGRTYDGTGMKIMMQDDGPIGPHIDYQGRLAAQYVTFDNGNHGDHVSGTIFGAGNRDPNARGMAYGAELYNYNATWASGPYYQGFDSIYNHYYNPGIKISSTSYSNGCNAGYTSLTQKMDQQIRQMPSLMHVFSAGNSNGSSCGYGAGTQWGNITGGHKVAKNVTTVANVDYADLINSSSSRGPASDGRIKPDVSAVGTNVNSTMNPNAYQVLTGTSMSCPGVSGTLAQLYHGYKSLNGNVDPPSALMKAILMNSCDDIGNAGPDYIHGYGRINALRAIKDIEAVNWLNDSVSQGNTNVHTLNVPAGVAQVKIMLYWHDPEAAISATKALINDLNLVVTDPSATAYNPWVLDPTPNAATLALPAVRSVDTLNNMEQVTIDAPPAGVYTLSVEGLAVPTGPQVYYIVYEYILDEITVTYPMGGESFAPSTAERVRWDAYGNTGNFTLEYSVDSGATWTVISTTVAGTRRYYTWTIPNFSTGNCFLKVSRGAVVDSSDSYFSIIRIPTGLTMPWACNDSIRLNWNAVTGATSYTVFQLGAMYMDSVATTTNLYHIFYGMSTTATYWFSVRANGPNGAVGERAYAIQKNPGTFGCSMPGFAEYNNTGFNVAFFPNPSNGEFSISITNLDAEALNISVTDMQGKTIYADNLHDLQSEYSGTINLSKFASGVYFLNVISDTGQYHTKLTTY